MRAYLLALGITLVVEVPTVALVFRRRWLRMAVACAVATTATHLVLHFVLPRLIPASLLIGEIGATLSEAAVYFVVGRPRDLGRSLVASGLANALSFGAGFVLFRLLVR